VGTYAAVKFDHATRKMIYRYCVMAKLPNVVRPDKLHSTLLFSDVDLPLYEPNERYTYPLVAYPVGLAIWDSRDDQNVTTKCLVVMLDCPHLTDRHNQLMKEHDATYPFPSYCPHLTLSYDIGDIDPETLPFFDGYVPHVVITGEYREDLNEPIDTSSDAINKTVVSNA